MEFEVLEYLVLGALTSRASMESFGVNLDLKSSPLPHQAKYPATSVAFPEKGNLYHNVY